MKKTLDELLDEYFRNNRVEEIPTTDKEKLRLVKDILYTSKVNSDWLELSHNRQMEVYKGKDELTEEEAYDLKQATNLYVNKIEAIEVNLIQGRAYRDMLKNRIVKNKKPLLKRLFK